MPRYINLDELVRDSKAMEKYKKALKKIVRGGGCLCGGRIGPDMDTFTIGRRGALHVEDCGPMIAAKALGMKITRRG